MELLAEQECYQEAEAYYQKARNCLLQMGRETDPRTEDVAAYIRAMPILRQISINDYPWEVAALDRRLGDQFSLTFESKIG